MLTRNGLAGLAFVLVQLACLIGHYRIEAGCPVTDNPSQMFQCLTINPQAFIDLISKGDYKSFCHMANGYMTCMTTYVRDCLGGKAATGILEELQDLNLKCCISGRTQDCIIKNPSLLQKCFAGDNQVTLADGSIKSIIDVTVGDQVKAVDLMGNLIDTQVVSILHKNVNSTTMFQTFYDADNNQISLTNSHLIYVKDRGYVKASTVEVGDRLQIFSSEKNRLVDFTVSRVGFELKRGYIAPLTNQGTLLVNGVHSSCYAEVNSHYLADVFMTPLKLWSRLTSLVDTDLPSQITEDTNVNSYANAIYKLAITLVPSMFV